MTARSTASDEFVQAKLTKHDGDIKDLRALFNEYRKSALKPQECRQLRSSLAHLHQVEALASRAEANRAMLEEHQQHHRESRQMLDTLHKKVQQHAQKIHAGQAARSSHDAEQEQQMRVQQQVEQMFAQFSDTVQQDLEQMRNLLQRSMQTVDQMVQRERENTNSMREFKNELDASRSDMLTFSQDSDKMRRQSEAMRRSVEEATKEAKRVADEVKSRNLEASSAAQGLGKQAQQKLNELEARTKGMDQMSKLQHHVEHTQREVYTLVRNLYDSGALIPPKPVQTEEDVVPVGTVELGEDIFSARLLIRLGLLKARSERIEEHLKQKAAPAAIGYSSMELVAVGDEEDSDWDESSILDWEDNVTGLVLPDMETGGAGWFAVNEGLLSLCLMTSVTQVFVVSLLIYYGLTTGSCLSPFHPMTHIDWFILHFSKAAATVSAGFFMGKDLMELSNYLMTSILLDIHIRPDVLTIAFLRVMFTISIGIANLVMFIGLTSPFEVWINLTALGFVSEMGSHMLEVAKRGFFGHHISKATCQTNFKLNFMQEYPRWFGIAQFVTITLGIGFSACFGTLLFFAPDIYSDAEGMCPIETQGIWAYFNTTHHHAENFVAPPIWVRNNDGHHHHHHGH